MYSSGTFFFFFFFFLLRFCLIIWKCCICLHRASFLSFAGWLTPQIPRWSHSQDWAKLQPGARSFIKVSHVGGRSPWTWVIFRCPSWSISRKTGWEVVQLGLEPVLLSNGSISVPGSDFIQYATVLLAKWPLCRGEDTETEPIYCWQVGVLVHLNLLWRLSDLKSL